MKMEAYIMAAGYLEKLKAEAEAEEKWRQEQYWNTGVMPLGNFRMENGKVVERNGKPTNE